MTFSQVEKVLIHSNFTRSLYFFNWCWIFKCFFIFIDWPYFSVSSSSLKYKFPKLYNYLKILRQSLFWMKRTGLFLSYWGRWTNKIHQASFWKIYLCRCGHIVELMWMEVVSLCGMRVVGVEWRSGRRGELLEL